MMVVMMMMMVMMVATLTVMVRVDHGDGHYGGMIATIMVWCIKVGP